MPIVTVSTSQLVGARFENAREILGYAASRVSLSDRVRFLAAVDQKGSLPLGKGMTTIRNGTYPIGAIAALALRRFENVDRDPDTSVALTVSS